MIDWHSLTLDGKKVDDDALARYGEFLEFIPAQLHEKFEDFWESFKQELAACDIAHGITDGLCLFKFHRDYPRMGSITGTFVTTQKDILDLCGRTIILHDYLGKHSEIEITFEESDFELVSDSRAFIQQARQLNIRLDSGFYPWDHVEYRAD